MGLGSKGRNNGYTWTERHSSIWFSYTHLPLYRCLFLYMCSTKCKDITYRRFCTSWRESAKMAAARLPDLTAWNPISSPPASIAACLRIQKAQDFHSGHRETGKQQSKLEFSLAWSAGWNDALSVFPLVFLPDLHTRDQPCLRWIADDPCKKPAIWTSLAC